MHGVNGTGNVTTWIALDEKVNLFKLMQDYEYVFGK